MMPGPAPSTEANRKKIRMGQIHKLRSDLEAGIALFNSGQFFDAHEVWEQIWLHARLPRKTFLQGLIQIVAAFHHYSRENRRGAQSLLAAGLAKLDQFPADYRGMALGEFRAAVGEWASALGEETGSGLPRAPKIRMLRPARVKRRKTSVRSAGSKPKARC